MTQTYLKPGLVGGHDHSEVVHDGVVLGVGVGLPAEVGHVGLDEDAELHREPPRSTGPGEATVKHGG